MKGFANSVASKSLDEGWHVKAAGAFSLVNNNFSASLYYFARIIQARLLHEINFYLDSYWRWQNLSLGFGKEKKKGGPGKCSIFFGKDTILGKAKASFLFKVTENQLAITSMSGVRVYHIDFESNQIGTWELLLLYTQIGFQSPFHTVVWKSPRKVSFCGSFYAALIWPFRLIFGEIFLSTLFDHQQKVQK